MSATALVVIDLQRAAFDGVRCPPVDSASELIRNACTLVDAARTGGHPVVFVQHCEGAGEPFEEGTEQWQLHASLVPAPGELVVRKRASSSFEHTGLDARLKALQVDALVLCGLQSEHCVSNTARAALDLGYDVHVAADAHGTWPWAGRTAPDIREEANEALAHVGAMLAPTQALAAALRHGDG